MESAVRIVLLVLALAATVAAQTCPQPYWEGTPSMGFTPGEFQVFDDGSGPTIFAGTANGVYSGSGPSGRTFGTLTFAGSFVGAYCFAVYDDGYGNGPCLYAGGAFISIGGVAANNVARWTGTTWAPVVWGAAQGDGVPIHVYSMRVFQGDLYLAGSGSGNGGSGTGAHGLFQWNGYTMASVVGPGTTCGVGLGGPCAFRDSVVVDDGSGPALYLLGPFGWYGGVGASWTTALVTKYDGATFSPVAISTNEQVRSLGSFHNGVSDVLCAGGGFTILDGVAANCIAARVNGSWTPLGSGLTIPGVGYGFVSNMRSYNDGTGNRLYVVGLFPGAGGVTSQGIASWDGSQWHGLGGGLVGTVQPNGWWGYGSAVAGFTDETCSALWVGGTFTGASGGVQSPYAARYRSASLTIAFDQPGAAGTGVTIHHANLIPGHDYHSLFSFTPCAGGPGTGVFGGLCAPNVAYLLDQFFAVPPGTLPFHLTATTPTLLIGPYVPIPGTPFSAGGHVEALTFDFTNGTLGCISSVGTLVIQ